MMKSCYRLAVLGTCALVGALLSFLPLPATAAWQTNYFQTNLVSNLPGETAFTDTNLDNPWGLGFDIPGNLIIADHGRDLTTFYQSNGAPIDFRVISPGNPTSLVFNHSDSDFVFQDPNTGAAAPARLLITTETGTVRAYHPDVDRTNTYTVIDHTRSNAVYTGLTFATLNKVKCLYVANFRSGRVEVFDPTFRYVGSFTDPDLPKGYGPFNVRNFGGFVLVAWAKQLLPEKRYDEPGAGNGFIDVFMPSGVLLRRLVTRGALNSPWGMALAPNSFGKFGGNLLVGNSGDGRINVFNPVTGQFLGRLADGDGNHFIIENLRALKFKQLKVGKGDDDSSPYNANDLGPVLYYTSVPNAATNGVIGAIGLRRVNQ